MATTKLSRSISSAGTTTKATFSAWVKRTGLLEGFLFYSYENANNNFRIRFNPEVLNIEVKQGGSNVGVLQTNRAFRDVGAWMHIVVALDSTLVTADDRMKLYINGEQVTSFGSRTNPSQGGNMSVNESGTQYIGAQDSSNYFDGCMSHVHYVDGNAYAASDFGETDATTGIWKIKTSPSLTYGTNGFFLFKDNASATDQSGQTNNFTASGTLTLTVDNPSNNFATINRLNPNAGENIAFSAGNLSIDSTGGAHRNAPATIYLPLGNGKFYWEMKVDRMSTHVKIGLVFDEWSKLNKPTPGEEFSGSNQGYSYRNDGQKENNGTTSYGNSYTVGDVIRVAFDTENRKLYFGKAEVWQNSGDPTSGATGTGAAFTVDAGYVYAPIVNLYDADVSFNFGNGFFGTTQITSEGTNASGEGKFEYDVPTGYTALCTKGLNL